MKIEFCVKYENEKYGINHKMEMHLSGAQKRRSYNLPE